MKPKKKKYASSTVGKKLPPKVAFKKNVKCLRCEIDFVRTRPDQRICKACNKIIRESYGAAQQWI